MEKDAVVLTQTSSSRSVAFLSQSFNEEKDVSIILLLAVAIVFISLLLKIF
jgi:hypothetical protein